MAVTEGFKDFVTELLSGVGPVTIRNMFGGAGVYADGVMFAIVADDVLYLKADEVSQPLRTKAWVPSPIGPAKALSPCAIGRCRRVSWRSRRSLLHGRAKPIASPAQARRNRRESGADRFQNRPNARCMMAATPVP